MRRITPAFTRTAFLVCSLSLITAGAHAEATPTGGEFQVNEVTTGRQLNPAVAAFTDGSVFVVWEGEDGDGRGIFGRQMGRSGGVGSEFQVSVTTTDNQTSADVAILPGGDAVVVWEDEKGSDPVIGSRHYDASLTPSSVLDLTSATAQFDVFDPKAAGASSSGFVVVWESYDSSILDSRIQGQFLADSGAKSGGIFSVETAGMDEFVSSPSLDSRAVDGFVMAWNNSGSVANQFRVRNYDGSGSADGAFVVAADRGSYSSVAGLSDDGFLVSWNDPLDGIQRRRFAGDGTDGGTIDITSSTQSTQRDSDAIALPNERAAVAWRQAGGSQPNRILIQVVAADGTAECEITVDETPLTVSRPHLAYDSLHNELVVVWARRGGAGADQEEIWLRRYALSLLFVSGFESGDLTEWSSSVP